MFNRRRKRKTVEDYRDIDINRWSRQGLLNQSFTARWTNQLGDGGSIKVDATPEEVVLSYTLQKPFSEPRSMRQHIGLAYTPCNYGGERAWFSCPGCQTRRAKLIMGPDGAYCRKCYDLPYRSQNCGALRRLISKREKIEARLASRIRCTTRERLETEWIVVQGEIDQLIYGKYRIPWN